MLDISESKFLSLVELIIRKTTAPYDGRRPKSFRLHRFEDVALLTDG
jgi:hypothetical protein